MPPKKLSDSDKQDIISQYRTSDETTVTLAVQYGVSTSTISRFLKQSLAEPEYEALVQKKRSGGRPQSEPATKPQPERQLEPLAQTMLPGLELPVKPASRAEPFANEDFLAVSASSESPSAFDRLDSASELEQPRRRQRKRLTAGFISAEQLAASAAHLSQLEQAPPQKSLDNDLLADSDPTDLDAEDDFELEAPVVSSPVPPPKLARPLPVPKAAAFDDAEDDDDLVDLDDDDLEDDDLEDGDDLDEFDEADSSGLESMQLTSQLQIVPLPETALPRTCYVVVDRSSELITRPLKDFAELGQIRSQEQEKTLPIFDNHRVAKRFLRRMQRIVKVPDGRVFQKVKPYLQAKGITHLLIDGQIYSLS